MSNLYFVQNMFIFLEECFVTEPCKGDCFTLNPFYIKDMATLDTLRKDIEQMFDDIDFTYVPFGECNKTEWDTIFMSSYMEDSYQPLMLRQYFKSLVLVEDGLFDYVNPERPYDFYQDKTLYLFKPELASDQAKRAKIKPLKYEQNILTRFQNRYQAELDSIVVRAGDVPILYTTPIAEDYDATEMDVKLILKTIRDYLKIDKLIIKQHPRDYVEWKLEGIETINCPKNIPGQFLDKACKGLNLFIFPSTVSFMCSENSEIVFLEGLLKNPKYDKDFECLHNTSLFKRNSGIKVYRFKRK